MTEVTPAPETWLPVIDYEGLYLVSDFGRVRSLPRNTTSGRIMKLPPDKHGYPWVTLTKNGKQKRRAVHQLVAEAFIGPCPEGQEVRHKDGDPANARADNLCYGTHGENMMDAVRHGTHPTGSVTHCPQDHEYTEENTRWYDGRRWCRQCAREHALASYYRAKEAGKLVRYADLPPERLEHVRAAARERGRRYKQRKREAS